MAVAALSRFLHAFHRRPLPGKPPRLLLRCEELESREVPSAYYVTTLDDSGAGSLRDAIAQANDDPSLIADIYFEVSGTIYLESQLPWISTINLTIHGPTNPDGTPALTIQRDIYTPGGWSYIVINNLHSQTYTIQNIAFNNGQAEEGGAIHTGGDTVLENCTFTNCTATNGGAIYSDFHLSINHCTFRYNTATNHGGAICEQSVFSANIISITDSVLTNNWAGTGGAVYLYLGSAAQVTIQSSTFMSNGANYGAGIYQYCGGLSVSGSNFYAHSTSPAIIIESPSTYVNVSMFVMGNTGTNNGTFTSVNLVVISPWPGCSISVNVQTNGPPGYGGWQLIP